MKSHLVFGGWVLALCPVLGMAGPAEVMQTLRTLAGRAPQPGASVNVVGLSSGAAVVGAQVSYEFAAPAEAFALAVHVDAHGVVQALLPDSATRGLSASIRNLEISEPLGRESVFVFWTDKSLSEAQLEAAGTHTGEGYATALASTIAAAGLIASAETSYLVEAAPGATQYTTRGIIRKVVSTAQSGSAANLPSDPCAASNEQGGLRVNCALHIEFAFNSVELSPTARKDLDVFGAALQEREMAAVAVVLGGHTDDVGGEEFNLALSERRARAVRDYLVSSFDVQPQRFTVKGYGKSKPKVTDHTDAARARNRRVEFDIDVSGALVPEAPDEDQ